MSDQDQTDQSLPQEDSPAQGEAPGGESSDTSTPHPAESAADRATESAEAVAREVGDPENADLPTESDATALDEAAQATEHIQSNVGGDEASSPMPYALDSFDRAGAGEGASPFSLLDDVNLDVKIELGRTRMYVEDVLKLGAGAVVELDKLAGDPVDIYVNNRHVARGEILVLNDNFCVRVSEILDPNTDDS